MSTGYSLIRWLLATGQRVRQWLHGWWMMLFIGAQLAVLMVSTTAPEDIFAYRNRMLLSPPAAAYV